MDVLQEFYNVSAPEAHRKIDELFKMIITYEAVLKEAQYKKDNQVEMIWICD